MARNLRIVPGPNGPDCMGTQVFCGDEELKVSRIELVADVETKRWRVKIETWAAIDGEIVAEESDGS